MFKSRTRYQMSTEELKNLLQEGVAQRAIAAKLGISQTTLRFRMKKLGLVSNVKSKKESSTCKSCGILIPRNQHENIYCSIACSANEVKKASKERFLKGENSNRVVQKRCVIDFYGEKCTLCGQGPTWNGKILVLQVDHVDGNSDNNLPDNLRLLCPNCHTQTDTYGSKGSGNRYKKVSKRNKYLQEYKAGWSER